MVNGTSISPTTSNCFFVPKLARVTFWSLNMYDKLASDVPGITRSSFGIESPMAKSEHPSRAAAASD